MPQAFVAQLAKKKGVSTEAAEKKWEEAKKAAAKYKDKDSYYAVVTSIFKKMMGEELSLLDKVYINEVEGVGPRVRAETVKSFFGNT